MFSLQLWIKLAFPALALAAVLWGFLRAWKQRPKLDGPRCAHCHYLLIALATDRCPECGSNPAVTGIIPAAKAALEHFRLPGWTALAFILVLLCLHFFSFDLDYRYFEDNLTSVASGPAIGSCNSQLTIVGQGWSSRCRPRELHMTCTVAGTNARMDYDFRTRTWTLFQPSGIPRQFSGTLSPTDIESCFPPSSIHPLVVRSLQSSLNKAAALRDMYFVDSSILRVEGAEYLHTRGTPMFDSLFTLTALDCYPWLAIALLGLALPYIRIWRDPPLTGTPALDYLRRFAVPKSSPGAAR